MTEGLRARQEIVMYGGVLGFNFMGGDPHILDVVLKERSAVEAAQIAILAYDLILNSPLGGKAKAIEFFNKLSGFVA
jgi:hypothetical protein